MWRGKIHPSSRDLSNACQKLLSSIYFKLRRLRPYIICSLDFKADFNEENELQLSVYGELDINVIFSFTESKCNPSLSDIIKVLLLFPILGTAISLAYNGKTRLQIENTKGN